MAGIEVHVAVAAFPVSPFHAVSIGRPEESHRRSAHEWLLQAGLAELLTILVAFRQ